MNMEQKRVVIDTNCLLQILGRHSVYHVSEDAHFRVLNNIPFPVVHVIGLEDFYKDLF